jgi:predicted nuclease of predicted toxin-antitoxin system
VKIWLDAQLSPSVAEWLKGSEGVAEAFAIQLDPDLRSARDTEIFSKAGEAGAVVMTKDRDFVDLLHRLGPPPQVIWVTCGNTSNRMMRRILSSALPDALTLLRSGEPLVEISDAASTD